jgi:GT2 family glycosyltransferase
LSASPEISIVIPSWNGAEALTAHLPSVLEAARGAGSAEVVVADDASDDGTAELLRTRFASVRSIRRAQRGGFAPACNSGVAEARGLHVVLLNNDMEVAPAAVALLVASLARTPDAFAAVPSIVRVSGGAEEAHTTLRFRRGVCFTALDGEPAADPAYACGGAMAFRREEFLALGGFDPLFAPFYWEDVDLSYRARKRGRRVIFVGEARVDHDHGRTIGARFDARAVARIYERNRLLFTWKNLTDPALWRRHLAALPVKTAWDLAAHPAFVAGLRDALRLRRRVAPLRARERADAVVPDRELLAERAPG